LSACSTGDSITCKRSPNNCPRFRRGFFRATFFNSYGDRVYEIAFPYLTPTDIAHHDNQLEYVFNFSITGQSYTLRVTDEVLDLDTIKEENELPEWENKLGSVWIIQRLFNSAFGWYVYSFIRISEDNTADHSITQLQEKLEKINVMSRIFL
jgi:hypothetical protein